MFTTLLTDEHTHSWTNMTIENTVAWLASLAWPGGGVIKHIHTHTLLAMTSYNIQTAHKLQLCMVVEIVVPAWRASLWTTY